MEKKAIDKSAIIADYLTGTNSYRKIGIKYGIDFRLVHSWVTKLGRVNLSSSAST